MKKREIRMLKLSQLINSEGKQDKISSFDWIEDIEKLMRLERQYHRLQDLACNGWPKPVTEYRDGKKFRYNVEDEKLREQSEKQEEKIQEKALHIAKRNGWSLEFQGDPRGRVFVLKLFPDSIRDHSHILEI